MNDVLRRLIWRAKRLLGRTVTGGAARKYPLDFDAEMVELVEHVRPFTMTSPERIFALVSAVRYVIDRGISGALVECGVWKGGSMMAVALTLQQMGITDRDLFLFDTFEGMPPPQSVDRTFRNESAQELMDNSDRDSAWVWAFSPQEAVQEAIMSTGYDMSRVHLIKGPVEETLPEAAPQEIAILRLDTDWYESTRHELEHLYPRLSSQGVMIVDDYGHWQGARRAVDEYFSTIETPILLNRIDYTGRLVVKP